GTDCPARQSDDSLRAVAGIGDRPDSVRLALAGPALAGLVLRPDTNAAAGRDRSGVAIGGQPGTAVDVRRPAARRPGTDKQVGRRWRLCKAASARRRGKRVMPEPAELSGTFGRYQILSRIGAGGMGTVYLALDTKLNRRVALKVPRFTEDDDIAIERFY